MIQGDAMPRLKAVNGYNATTQGETRPRYKAVNGSAKQNLLSSFMKSELNIMHGEKERNPYVIQHNTNDTKTGQKPG